VSVSGQEYKEELYKKGLNDPDNHDGVVSHLEQEILECEVKWVLGSITTNKASGGDEIPAELFKILKNDAIKDDAAALNIPANLENSAVATGLEKVSFHSNLKKRQCRGVRLQNIQTAYGAHYQKRKTNNPINKCGFSTFFTFVGF